MWAFPQGKRKGDEPMTDYSNDPHQNPYWQNINHQNNGYDQNNNGYYNNYNGFDGSDEFLKNKLATTAFILGICSLFVGILMPVILPGIMGCLAILLAILSKGRGSTYPRNAKYALAAGIISVTLNAMILVGSFVSTYQMLNNEEGRAEINEWMEDFYGESFDDMLDGIGGDPNGSPIEEEPANPSNDTIL